MFSSWNQYLGDSRSWYWTTIDLFATTVEDAIDTGEIREVNSIKVATLYLNAILSLMSHRTFSMQPEEIEDDVNDLMEIYFDGIAVRNESLDFIGAFWG